MYAGLGSQGCLGSIPIQAAFGTVLLAVYARGQFRHDIAHLPQFARSNARERRVESRLMSLVSSIAHFVDERIYNRRYPKKREQTGSMGDQGTGARQGAAVCGERLQDPW